MKKTKRGFTIVELVIVIGVIAILSAVLIPTFVNLSSKAKDATAKQEVADAYTAYVIDKGENAKAQTQVCVSHSEGFYTYLVEASDSHAAGWDKVETNPYSTDTPDVYNGISVYEAA